MSDSISLRGTNFSDTYTTFLSAKYDLDSFRKSKNDISKIVAQKKKDSKGQDKCEEEIAQSKSLDDKMEELNKQKNDVEKELEK